MESLTDLRWDPRLDDEKSRNSSTHEEGCWELAWRLLSINIEGILWVLVSAAAHEVCVMFGTFGGNCAAICFLLILILASSQAMLMNKRWLADCTFPIRNKLTRVAKPLCQRVYVHIYSKF